MLWRRRRRTRSRDGAPAKSAIKPSMTHREIEDAGGMVDVPYVSLPASPDRLQYADLGEEKRWTPPEGFTIAGIPYAAVVAGLRRSDPGEGPAASEDDSGKEPDSGPRAR